MYIKAIKTEKIIPNSSIKDLYAPLAGERLEGAVLAVTSKVLSFIEGRLVPVKGVDKGELVAQEADQILQTTPQAPGVPGIYLTIKDGILIPSAGIDESNGQGNYVLYPQDSFFWAQKIWEDLRQRFNLGHFGVIVTDSHTTPLRRGVTGIALAWCGFEPLHNYVGKKDLDGKSLQYTNLNLIDSLATAATLNMGEGDECTPLALMGEVPKIKFQNHPPTDEDRQLIKIAVQEDIYGPLLVNGPWL